ncbi:MAG: HlyD family efflux transporter periplasmic adaptor subunit [Pedobacter sp.]|nr:MAG: HlyD family efflux transporter periplasmic adaptor subunit [Pedobacter sp.]
MSVNEDVGSTPNEVEAEVDNLFRSEMLEAQNKDMLGEVLLTWPRFFSHAIFLLSAVTVTLVLSTLFVEYSSRTRVFGKLIHSLGVAEINSRSNGEIDSIFVFDGQKVHKGDSILRINSEAYLEKGNGKFSVIIDEMESENRRLVDSEVTVKHQLDLALLDLESQITRDMKSIDLIRSKLDLKNQELKAAVKIVRDSQILIEKHVITNSELEIRKDKLMNLQNEIINDNKFLVEAGSALTRNRIKKEILISEHKREQSTIDGKVSENRQRIFEVQSQRDSILKSPTNGFVNLMSLSLGQSIKVGSPLYKVTPSDDRYEIHLFVDSKAIPYIKKESEVLLRYDSLPVAKFGSFKGKVNYIGSAEISNLPTALLKSWKTNDK